MANTYCSIQLFLKLVLLACFFIANIRAMHHRGIPLAVDDPVYLTENPCRPGQPSVAKLIHSNYELHWLDNNPSLILYPSLNGSLMHDNCLIIDFQGWMEKGSNSTPCEVQQSVFGPYSLGCPDTITPLRSRKDLNWTFSQGNNTITWRENSTEFAGVLEVVFELITEDTNRTFSNTAGTATRTLELLKDSFEFSLVLTNYTTNYKEILGGDYFELLIPVAFLLGNPAKIYTFIGQLNSVIAPDRVVEAIESGSILNFTPYTVDDPSINFMMQKRDGSFNVSLTQAAFLTSNPPTSSNLLAAQLNRTDLIGFDLPSAYSGEYFYYDGEIVGQAFIFGFAMSKDQPQSFYFDPNVAFLLDAKNEYHTGGESATSDDSLLIGLTVGLICGGVVLVVVITLVVLVMLVLRQSRAKRKRKAQHASIEI